MTMVKICGIKNVESAQVALEYGADYLGFVFASSKRMVTPEQVRAILEELPPETKSVGVFLDQPPEVVEQITAISGISMIQLHGSEDLAAYRFIQKPIIAAVGVTPEGYIIEPVRSGADYYLLDTRLPGQIGGTGKPFYWQHAAKTTFEAPVFLAGGLNPENVKLGISALHPYGVDVSSGVETNGTKDHDKIRRFIESAR